MAIVKSGATSDQWTIDPTSKAGRITLYDSTGALISSGNPIPIAVQDITKATYSAAYKAITPIASATSPFAVIQGSASKTIKIIRVRFSSTATTGTTGGDLWGSKFTTISGGTTIAGPTIAKADSNDGNATAVTSLYSVVPSTATQADGFYFSDRYVVPTAAATGPLPVIVNVDMCAIFNMKAMTLRGTGQWFGVGFSVVGSTPLANLQIIWTEE